MPKKIRFETEEVVEEVEISGVSLPQIPTGRDQAKRIKDILEGFGKTPKPLFKEKGVVRDTRNDVKDLGIPASKKKPDSKKDVSKDKKPARKL